MALSDPRFIWLPDCDQDGVPKQKMPNCPNCGEDELGMMMPGQAYCYRCCRTFLQAVPIVAAPEIDDDQWDGCVGDESEGTCPACGARLQYVELLASADLGVNRCPECGWEGAIS